MNGLRTFAAAVAVLGLAASARGGQVFPDAPQAFGLELVKEIIVPADAGWIDTGLDLAAGEEVLLRAAGRISLQKGNPEGDCGPEGLDLMTVEQPVPSANLGVLIGKIAQLVAVRVEEDSGAEIRDEIFVVLVIGSEKALAAPVKGRLYLGINEDVIKDNAGEFTVRIFRRVW